MTTASPPISIEAGPARQRLPRGRRRPHNAGIAILALLPFVLFMLVFAVYPIIELVRLSFSETTVQNGVFVSAWHGLTNYLDVITDPANLKSIGITLAFIVLTVGLTLILGLAVALLVDRAVLMLPIARNMLIWPAVIAPVVVSVMWLMLLSPTVGGLNKLLESIGLPTQSWLNNGFSAFLSVVVVDVWHWFPIVFLFLYTALKGIGADVLEAARIDGASESQVIRLVILPILTPAIVIVGMLRLVMTIKAFDEMYLLTRGGPDGATNLVSLQIRAMFFDQLDFGGAAAFSVVIVLATMATIGVVFAIRASRNRRAT